MLLKIQYKSAAYQPPFWLHTDPETQKEKRVNEAFVHEAALRHNLIQFTFQAIDLKAATVVAR